MGFLQDLGGFISDVNDLRDEMGSTVRGVASSLADDAHAVQQTVDDVKNDVSSTVADIEDTLTQSTNLPSSDDKSTE